MIYLNYIFQVVFLLILLSVESTLATPIFTLYLFFKLLDRFNTRDDHSFYYLIASLLLLSFCLALFYQLGISICTVLVFLYYYLRSLFGSKMFSKNFQQWQILQLSLFAVLQIAIFFLSGLSFNVFMLAQGLFVLILLIYRTIKINRL